jgi:hypothetical protein
VEKNEQELIREAVSKMLNADTVIRRKTKSKAQKKRELFVKAIDSIEHVMKRSGEMFSTIGVDFSSYDEDFLSIIDMLLFMQFDQQCFELISWYLYERMGPDGEADSKLLNENGEEVSMKNAYDLYDVLLKVNPNLQ